MITTKPIHTHTTHIPPPNICYTEKRKWILLIIIKNHNPTKDKTHSKWIDENKTKVACCLLYLTLGGNNLYIFIFSIFFISRKWRLCNWMSDKFISILKDIFECTTHHCHLVLERFVMYEVRHESCALLPRTNQLGKQKVRRPNRRGDEFLKYCLIFF